MLIRELVLLERKGRIFSKYSRALHVGARRPEEGARCLGSRVTWRVKMTVLIIAW